MEIEGLVFGVCICASDCDGELGIAADGVVADGASVGASGGFFELGNGF